MIYDIIIIFWIHFIADFLLQNNYMALNKSKKMFPLLLHCSVYTIPFMILGWFILIDWKFAIFNGFVHFIVDFITSKITHSLYRQEKYRLFFNVIGFDQAIHMTTLVLSYMYFSVG